MRTWALVLFLAAGAASAQDPAEPAGTLDRIQTRLRDNLARLPDFTCRQSIQRMRRVKPDAPWEKYDTMRVEVAYVGGEEVHGWSGSKLGEKELRELTGRGSVSTGSFATHARSAVLGKNNGYGYAGETELRDGRKAIRYDFEVPKEVSVFKVRAGAAEAVAGFRGAFWVHPETFDLMKLMIEVEEAPGLPVAALSEAMEYERMTIGEGSFLLPKTAELLIELPDGTENRNVTQVEACRQYGAESKIQFAGTEAPERPAAEPVAVQGGPVELPARSIVEVHLDTEIDPERAAAGDPVRAVLAKPLKASEKVLIPEGALLQGRLTRLEREAKPLPHYVIAMELTSVEWAAGSAEIRATMEDAAGQGVMRVQKTFMPTFDRQRRAPAMSILVREQQKGQGVIHWDARQSRVKKGLRMLWQLHGPGLELR